MSTSTALALPIRSERTIISTSAPQGSGNDPDFQIVTALKPFTDYIVVRIPHRGKTTDDPAYFRFLINPNSVRISHQTQDTQTMTRDGWKFAVWGEGFVSISMVGKTAGQYFTRGITDMFHEYTASYENLLELQSIFDNNGYWFEGENTSSLQKRRIKNHQDVELFCGEVIWSGIFERLTVTQSADNPFTADFNIQFTAWKERFRAESPYRNSLENNIQRGHTYRINKSIPVGGSDMSAYMNMPLLSTGGVSAPTLDTDGSLVTVGKPLSRSPAAIAATIEQQLPILQGGFSYTPEDAVIKPTSIQWLGFDNSGTCKTSLI